MKSFSIVIDNGHRRQEFTQEYTNEGYARLSLYHVMSNMLDSAIKESFKESEIKTEHSAPYACPSCKSDLDGGAIPKKYHEFYSPPYRFTQAIQIPNEKWRCPDCGHEWQLTQPTKELMSETSIND